MLTIKGGGDIARQKAGGACPLGPNQKRGGIRTDRRKGKNLDKIQMKGREHSGAHQSGKESRRLD